MKPTALMRRVDEAHSTLVEAAQDNQSAVLRTLASVLGMLPALDKPHAEPNYWHGVVANLNMLADTQELEEMTGEPSYEDITEEDWEIAAHLEDD